MESRRLSDSQLSAFDHDYVSEPAFRAICAQVRREFPSGEFSFLDVGGGKGFFCDRLLDTFGRATGTVLDNSELLLGQNSEHVRKRVALGSAMGMSALFPVQRFDVVFFNFVLHHFVAGTYAASRNLQRESLREASTLLTERGRVCVAEITYNGAVADNLPSFITYTATSSRLLAPLVRRLGANTAGCGICFLSAKEWTTEFERLQLKTSATLRTRAQVNGFARARLAAITARDVSNVLFWLHAAQ